MNEKIKKLLSGCLLTGLVLVISGCGSSDSSNDSEAGESSSSTNITQGSPYLNKIGENGQVLSADAESWDMVELVEEGLLVNNPSYTDSLKSYTFDEAEVYCENLNSGGYSDFKIPTLNEIKLILNMSIASEIEKIYFINYFKDYKSYTTGSANYLRGSYPRMWADDETTHAVTYNGDTKQYMVNGWYNSSSYEPSKKVFCVRRW